jgi:hypothetical protein
MYATGIDCRYFWGPSEPERAEMAAYERRGDYHAALQAKYERAARYPWLPVEPDRLEPGRKDGQKGQKGQATRRRPMIVTGLEYRR